jgi:hypothetical protein
VRKIILTRGIKIWNADIAQIRIRMFSNSATGSGEYKLGSAVVKKEIRKIRVAN